MIIRCVHSFFIGYHICKTSNCFFQILNIMDTNKIKKFFLLIIKKKKTWIAAFLILRFLSQNCEVFEGRKQLHNYLNFSVL